MPSALELLELTCELDHNPCGVDVPRPRLSWTLTGLQAGAAQSAWQVLVATTPELLHEKSADLWNSGRVESTDSICIPYAGAPLASSQSVVWTVRVWDQHGVPSAWAAPATWTMGLLSPDDWHGQWITARGALDSRPRTLAGYHSTVSAEPQRPLWIQLDLAQHLDLTAVRLHPLRHQGSPAYGFPRRFVIEVAPVHPTDWQVAARFDLDAAPPLDGLPLTFPLTATARYVRLRVEELGPVADGFALALSQIEVISQRFNVCRGAYIQASDSMESSPWGLAALIDGLGMSDGAASRYESLLLRRECDLAQPIRRAVLHVCGLGHYECSINGQRVGQDLLSPGWTHYRKTCLYDTHDVTALLQPGANAIGLLLGNGFMNVKGGRYHKLKISYGPLQAIVQLVVTLADGTRRIIATDEAWRVHPGPLTFSCVYGGEDFDARLLPTGWDQPGFTSTDWEAPLLVGGPGGVLRGHSHAAPPVRAFESFAPVSVVQIAPGVAVYDLGQNASMMPELLLRGVAGSQVRIIPAELIHPDGRVDRQSCGHGDCWWQVTLAGRGEERFFPRFFYNGCRYLQVECTAPAGQPLPAVLSLRGRVVHANVPMVGEFECSEPLFNRIRTLIRWAQRSNMMHVLTDCPHREKLGWLEQVHLNGPALRYEFDLSRLVGKALGDMADAQTDEGLVPDIAPEYIVFPAGFRDSPEWGSSLIIAAWQHYQWSGDLAVLRRHFRAMRRYLAYLGSRAEGHLLSHGLGDWFDVGPAAPGAAQLTPIAFTASAYYFYDAHLLGQIAALIGEPAAADECSRLAGQIRAAFNHAFLDPASGRYATGSQCAQAMALTMGLAPEELRPAVLARLLEEIEARGGAITAGDVGFYYLLRALADHGQSELIYRINAQTATPGYGYQLERGATSLAEAWDASPHASQNHFMLGHLMEWLHRDLLGIDFASKQPGGRALLIRPQPVGAIQWARGSHLTPAGRVECHWERGAGSFRLSLTLPPQTHARVLLPIPAAAVVTASSSAAAQFDPAGGWQVCAVESGTHVWQATWAAEC